MKKVFSIFIILLITACLLCGCTTQQIQLDYHESFVVSAFNELNGKIGYSKGYVLQDAKYAYITPEQLELDPDAFSDCTERQQYYFSQLYCCVELTVLMQGENVRYTRYFSISSYDFTPELEGKQCLEQLHSSLTFTRMDLSRLERFLS